MTGHQPSCNPVTCIHHWFEDQAQRTPDHVAIKYEEQQLSYAELNARANQLSHFLRRRGVKRETLVGLCMERSVEMMVAIIGIMKAGGAYVPLDPAYPAQRLSFILDDTQAPLLLTQDNLLPLLPDSDSELIPIDSDANRQLLSEEATDNPDAVNQAEDLCYIIYTSGSTGTPKGVLVEHRNVVHLFSATQSLFQFNTNDRWTLFHSYAFDFSVWEMWGALLFGGCLVIVPHWLTRTPGTFYELLCSEKITILNQTPSAFRQLMHAEPLHAAKTTDELKLRWIIFGGEALNPQSLAPWISRHGDNSPQLANMYGITETTVHVTCKKVTAADIKQSSSPIGQPINGLQYLVLNEQHKAVAKGTPGELYVGGAGVSRGYLNQAELTRERFITDPFANNPEERLYKTGDRVKQIQTNELIYLGRIDDQIKVRGFRIEPGEIESAITKHPLIKEAVVTATADDSCNKRLIAYVTGTQQHLLLGAELRQFTEALLPAHMVPSMFIAMDELPLTENGKIDRAALPSPGASRPDLATDFVAPDTPIELALSEIWQETLGLECIGIDDNFIDLGGDSLQAASIIGRIQHAMGLTLSFADFFKNASIKQMASEIENLKGHDETLPPLTTRSANPEEKPPLSYGQQQIWLICQIEPDTPIYNEPMTVRHRGPLRVDALEKAISTIIGRHESLRTTFPLQHAQPQQSIAPIRYSTLKTINISHLPKKEREYEARRIATIEARQPLSLKDGPLIRITLVQLDEEEQWLFLTKHHAITDAVSMFTIFFRELVTLYNAFANNEPMPLAKLPLQYADYAIWQQQQSTSQRWQQQLDYWRQQLAELAPLQLPSLLATPPQPNYCGSRHTIRIPGALRDALKRVSHDKQCTLFTTLLTAFKVLLYRYSQQQDIPVATVISTRSQPALNNIIGYFLNTVVIRSSVCASSTIDAYLHQVSAAVIAANTHGDVPFSRVVEALNPDRQHGLNPLFQVMFIMEPPVAEFGDDWSVSQLDVDTGAVKCDLTMELDERHDGIIGRIEYRTDLFDAATIERMAGHYETLLESICQTPEAAIAELPMLGADEQKQLCDDWNATQQPLAEGTCLHQLFEKQAIATPDAQAVVCANERITYKQLNERANQLAHHLRDLGAKTETIIGVYMARSIDTIVALFGILKAGAAYLPLDPAYPQQRISFMLSDSRAKLVISQSHLASHIVEPGVECVILDGNNETIDEKSHDNLTSTVQTSHLAYVIYTSGSTGQPKGVAIEHRSPVALVTWAQSIFSEKEAAAVLCSTSICFDLSIFEIFLPLSSGGKIVLAENALALNSLPAAKEITLINTVPSVVTELLRSNAIPSSVRTINLAGEPLTSALVNELYAATSVDKVYDLYGPSEDTTYSTYALRTPDEKMATIGRPIANTQTYILDQNRHPVPVGVPGELFLGGAGLARGYLNRNALTTEKFIVNPFDDSGQTRLYRSGDLARYLPDGNIQYLGRIDNQVKVRGYRIELGEIEMTLLQHPAVNKAVATTHGEAASRRLLAYVVYEQGEHATVSELRQFVKERLPEQMVPALYIELTSIPLTPNGKVDRDKLPPPFQRDIVEHDQYEAPSTTIEKIIAESWQQTIAVQRVGIHDNFFDLGGHSLLAMQAIAIVEKQCGYQINPRQMVFDTLTQIACGYDKTHEEMQKQSHKPALLKRLITKLRWG